MGKRIRRQQGAAPKALLASRTNTLFSLPMLYFMGSSAHLPNGMVGTEMTALIASLIVIAVLELNAIFGKLGPMTTVRGVITSSLVLTVALWAVLQL